jgi:hypothetical protein
MSEKHKHQVLNVNEGTERKTRSSPGNCNLKTVFWYLKTCILVEIYLRSGEPCWPQFWQKAGNILHSNSCENLNIMHVICSSLSQFQLRVTQKYVVTRSPCPLSLPWRHLWEMEVNLHSFQTLFMEVDVFKLRPPKDGPIMLQSKEC